jgi:hypothetical protein
MAASFEKQNQRITDWTNDTVKGLQAAGNAMGIRHRSNSPSPGASLDKLKGRTRYRDGIIDMVAVKFPRTLVWPNKGAGRGFGGAEGSTWVNAMGIRKYTDPDSLGKMGTGSRQAKPFFNNYLDGAQGVERLADIVAEETGDAIINNILIK